MRTAATNKKVRELIADVKDGRLIPQPEFQRRLVWTQRDKDRFLDTVIKGLPFPEIYIADGEVDLQTGQGTQLLVDGLQRVNTLSQFFEGDPDLRLQQVLPYQFLSDNDKRAFLQYDVAVRNLGAITREQVVEVFKRINATKYALTDIEINNAVYGGALKQFASRMAEHSFFSSHPIFNAQDYRRMGDLRFILSLICTMISGYFNRDDVFDDLLSRYNDDFDCEDTVRERMSRVLEFLDECNFGPRSRAWKKADLFTLIVEVDRQLNEGKSLESPGDVVDWLEAFYHAVDLEQNGDNGLAAIYYKSALQATNDRGNRIRRGLIIAGVLEQKQQTDTISQLREIGLMRSVSQEELAV
jgi:hypothetical protein